MAYPVLTPGKKISGYQSDIQVMSPGIMIKNSIYRLSNQEETF
jgi:hypothetical protein